MATVQVLCPNGRRQNVKITPNSKLLQVLEEVCQKQGFLPSSDFKLVHGRTSLDLSLSFRYANLSNNVKLELVKSKESRAEEDVLIALQLENGERLQATFLPSVSLWDVMLHMENQQGSDYKGKLTAIDSTHSPPLQPVCIYMREEVVGKMAMQMTPLRRLGLTGGKAVIRLVRRAVEDSELAEIMQRLEKEKAKQAKLEQIASRKLAEDMESSELCKKTNTLSREHTITESMQVDSSGVENMGRTKMDFQTSDTTLSSVQASSVSCDNPEQMEVEQSIHSAAVSSTSGASTGSGSSIGSVGAVGGIVGRANERQLPSQSEIERLRSLNIPGVAIITPQDFNDLSPQEQQIAQSLARRIMPQLKGAGLSGSGHVDLRLEPQPAPRQFTQFSFPEESKGKSLYTNELSEVNRQEFKPCDRQTVLYSLDEQLPQNTTSEYDLPDDFFELTEADLKTMMADQQKKMEEVAEAPLMTQVMRQARIEEHYAKYDTVVIRVQFPDRLVLQGLFNPRERVHALYNFVKDYLEKKSSSFYLYTSPPKCILNERTTLLESRLVPATLVYFGSESHSDSYLSTQALSEISSRAQAEEVAFSSLPGNAAMRNSDSVSQTSQHQKTKENASQSQASGKQPKWLKLGKK